MLSARRLEIKQTRLWTSKWRPVFGGGGVIISVNTLGIIPPSIALIIMADISIQWRLSCIDSGLILLMLSVLFGIFAQSSSTTKTRKLPILSWQDCVARTVPPTLLIAAVLWYIFLGYATPTEASGVGAVGAILLAALNRRLTRRTLTEAMYESAVTVGMIFMIFAGATIFAYVFRLLGGEHAIITLIEALNLDAWGLLIILLVTIFVMGFFFDWIEIALIIFPIFGPIMAMQDFGTHVDSAHILVWFAILVAINLQTSYLTPPFGFALFYLRSVAPPEMTLRDIYRGIQPFVAM